ncbi:hypothetical protein QZH41_000083 [Actinostola sp. cb2023]|nr:hypothetical protein QZH41_000083 [Actinostola sp. cb2023]
MLSVTSSLYLQCEIFSKSLLAHQPCLLSSQSVRMIGNKCKQQQEDLADKILVMWEKIKQTTKHHQKLLKALDIFILDSVLQKAAEIELDIKKGSTEWTVDKVHDDLKNEMTKVETVMSSMSTSIRYSMDYVVNTIIQYYTASKIYTALRETSLYEDIHKNSLVDTTWGYSDVAIAKFTRNTVNMKYGTMITGETEAIDYVNKVNSTLNEIEQDSKETAILICDDVARLRNALIEPFSYEYLRCSDGKGSFDDLHRQITTEAKLNRRKCYEITGLRIPPKSEIEGIVGRAASKLGFNSDCTQNEQPDEDEGSTSYSFYDDSDEEEQEELSPTQRKMVCDLRKTSKPKSRIAALIKVDETKVQAVRCKP